MEINPNLLSKEKLAEIIKEKDRKIESLEQKNHYDRVKDSTRWMLISVAIFIPTFITLIDPVHYLKQSHLNYFYFSISVLATIYCIRKTIKLGKRIYFNDDTISRDWIIEKEILVEELSTEKLKEELAEAESSEDYNYAIIIRDELKYRS